MRKTNDFDERLYIFDQVNGHGKWSHPDLWKAQKDRLEKFLEEYKKTSEENNGK